MRVFTSFFTVKKVRDFHLIFHSEKSERFSPQTSQNKCQIPTATSSLLVTEAIYSKTKSSFVVKCQLSDRSIGRSFLMWWDDPPHVAKDERSHNGT